VDWTLDQQPVHDTPITDASSHREPR
jgi:hypothetical protein